jgi:hypothetical protein
VAPPRRAVGADRAGPRRLGFEALLAESSLEELVSDLPESNIAHFFLQFLPGRLDHGLRTA